MNRETKDRKTRKTPGVFASAAKLRFFLSRHFPASLPLCLPFCLPSYAFRLFYLLASFAFCLLPSASSLFAEVPVKFTYQGNLREDGFLVNGARDMVFRIYDSSTSPAALWTSPVKSVNISTGVFKVNLEPSLSDWESGNLWLELEVEGVTLSPREEMTSSPYAVNSLLHSGKRYTTSASEPSGPNQGDLWMDTANDTLKFWTGVLWQDTALAGLPDPHAPTHAEGGGDEITSLGSHEITGPLTLQAGATIQAGAGAAGIFISTNVYLPAGAKYYGDGSALSGITAENADTLDLLHATDFMRLSGDLSETVTGDKTFVSSLTVLSPGGIFSPAIEMSANIFLSSASAANYGGISVSTHVYTPGNIYAAKYYGDGSSLSGVVAGEVPPSIDVSTINATASTPHGGINVTTNTFIQGNLGIGSMNPSAKLEIKGNDLLKYSFATGINASYDLVVSTGGNVGVGTDTPSAKMEVTGSEDSGEYIIIFNSGPKIAAWLRNK